MPIDRLGSSTFRGLAALAVLVIAGCGSSDKRIIILTNGADPFWDAMRVGMVNAEKEFDLHAAGLRAVMEVNDGSPKGQIDKLRQYANQTDIAAVAVSVTDAKNLAIARAMEDCQKAGIKVITIDSDVDRTSSRGARFAYLGTDNVVGGQELGKAAAGIRPQGGKYATFVGLKGAANAIERIDGFAAGAGPKFELAENLGDNMDKSVAKKNVKDALDRNPDLNVLVGIWSYNAHAIAEVVTEQSVRDKVTVVVFDAAPLAIKDLSEGKIDAMIVQNPFDMGYRGTRLMKALVQGDHAAIHGMLPEYDPEKKAFSNPNGDVVTTGLKVVHPDSGTPLEAKNFAATTEFLPLGEFQKWLSANKLIGS
jgi:ribose transport system substrate-binding protein